VTIRSPIDDNGGQVHAMGNASRGLAQSAAKTWFTASARADAERRRLYPGSQSWHVAARYAIALGAVGVAIAARWLLDPILGDRAQFATLFVVLLPLLLLVRPGTFLVAALVGLAASWYLFVPPRFSFRVEDSLTAMQLALYAVATVAASAGAWLAHAFRRRLVTTDRQLMSAQTVSSGAMVDITNRKRAEEADQRGDEFLAAIAHELRNPLGPYQAPGRSSARGYRTSG
jgi:signal transduction histidine kinase